MDYITWFLNKHFFIAMVVYPELALIYAIYMRSKIRLMMVGLLVGYKAARKGYRIWQRVSSINTVAR